MSLLRGGASLWRVRFRPQLPRWLRPSRSPERPRPMGGVAVQLEGQSENMSLGCNLRGLLAV